ncbi:MAG TPA: hypothetical protein DDY78_24110 [Planctomycetales bacterium]|jgi:hypothetical protein|nr:hypothetical protein [Planctomycetales bacterium]
MSWKEKVVGLYKRFGSPVKFAAKLVLWSIVPGGLWKRRRCWHPKDQGLILPSLSLKNQVA